VTAPVPGMDLVLPGSWWTVDLADPAADERSIHRMAERLLGTHDRLARQRAQLRASMASLVGKAREGGATDLYVALEMSPGVGLPLSLTVFWPPEIVLGSVPSTPSTVIELVRASLGSLDSAPSYEDGRVEDLGATSTLRRWRIVTSPADGDMPELGMLLVDYWIAVPGTQRVVLLTFSTPLVDEREALLEMFRIMVALIRWTDLPAETATVGA
jgi:hypothetical protein